MRASRSTVCIYQQRDHRFLRSSAILQSAARDRHLHGRRCLPCRSLRSPLDTREETWLLWSSLAPQQAERTASLLPPYTTILHTKNLTLSDTHSDKDKRSGMVSYPREDETHVTPLSHLCAFPSSPPSSSSSSSSSSCSAYKQSLPRHIAREEAYQRSSSRKPRDAERISAAAEVAAIDTLL